MPFRGSERGTQRRSGTSYQFQQGGATTDYRGAGARDPRSELGAYQYGVRTGAGTRGGGYGAAPRTTRRMGGERRPWEQGGPTGTAASGNTDYFNDVLMKRFGGDTTLAQRAISLYGDFGGPANPTGAVDWIQQWQQDPFKGRYRMDVYNRVKNYAAQNAQEQLDALTPQDSSGNAYAGFL